MKTKIKDTGKDYTIEMYVERREDLDITQPKPIKDTRPIIGYRPKDVPVKTFVPTATQNRFATFTRQP